MWFLLKPRNVSECTRPIVEEIKGEWKRTTGSRRAKIVSVAKRVEIKCFLDKRVAVADAIHDRQRQRSHTTGNNTGRLPVWHPMPTLKFRMAVGRECRAV